MFPLISKDINGKKIFTNNGEGLHYLSHIRLQDAITFQGYTYNIIGGVYFETRNYKIRDEIT